MCVCVCVNECAVEHASVCRTEHASEIIRNALGAGGPATGRLNGSHCAIVRERAPDGRAAAPISNRLLFAAPVRIEIPGDICV